MTQRHSVNYYKTLGLNPNAEACVIKAAYRALSKIYHPDKFDGDEEEAHSKMAKINEAYDVLKDKNKRKAYDNERPNGAEETSHSLTDDWSVVTSYYPELKGRVAIAQSIDNNLGSLLMSSLLKTKRYMEADEITRKIILAHIEHELGECEYATKAAYLYCKIHNNVEAADFIKNRTRLLGIELYAFSLEDRQVVCDSMGITLCSDNERIQSRHPKGVMYSNHQSYTTPGGSHWGLGEALCSVVSCAYPKLSERIRWIRDGMNIK